MEIIKIKVLREDFISRKDGVGYGSIREPHVYINFFLSQTIDNMGVFSDFSFIENPNSLGDEKGIVEGLRPQFKKKKWFKVGSKTTANTDSKLDNLRGYKQDNRYKVGFDREKETYLDFAKNEIFGVSRITEKDENSTTYVLDAHNDAHIGTEYQKTGLRYVDTNNSTTVEFTPQGVNDTNSSLSAISKEEYLMGIISKTETENDIFIDRGELSVTEPHLRLSEVETLDHLVKYGNGYFNVTK
jgi:hypothetical protein